MKSSTTPDTDADVGSAHAAASVDVTRAITSARIDVEDRKYLVEDARKAVHRLSQMAIDTFCVGLDSDAESSLGRIFGEHNNITISAVERLTQLLPRLYVRMRH